tara:strand:- start:678 stop:905 length:228 start_codon:yes stop_codon:yes gene_type:complete
MEQDIAKAHKLALVEAYLRKFREAVYSLLQDLYDALDDTLAYWYRLDAVKRVARTTDDRVLIDLDSNSATYQPRT